MEIGDPLAAGYGHVQIFDPGLEMGGHLIAERGWVFVNESAGDEYPSWRFMPISSNSKNSALALRGYMGSRSWPIRSTACTSFGSLSEVAGFGRGGKEIG
jgi:hypothetical protein